MKKSPYRHVLEAYLQEKERRGEKLPGLRGRVNYRGVALEAGIPKCKFRLASELRLFVDASVDRLGVLDGGRYEQPRRALDSEPSTPLMTYGDLSASGDLWLQKNGYAKASVKSYKSQLNAFKRYFGRTDESSTAEDFGVHFVRQLATFLKATGKGKAVASALRLWARIHYELHQSTSLPASFPAALNELVVNSGLTLRDITRAAGITSPNAIADWVAGDRRPTNPEEVARLEEVFNVSPGTLTSKLFFPGVQRATNIPKEWWPESWRKSKRFRDKYDKVIALLPERLLLGPLETLKPAFDDTLRRVLAGEGEPAYRRKIRGLNEKVYRLKFKNWPDRLKAEFVALSEYKTAPSGLSNKKRRGKWAKETVTFARIQLESFFGFLCLPADHSDPELRGLGLPVESLTLAWLAVQDAVEKYLDFCCLRAGAHNTGTETFINMWTSTLQPDGGWLWLHPELLERLPEPLQQKVDAGGGWQAYCRSVVLELKDSLASLKRNGQIKQTREPMWAIGPILDHAEPLSLIDAALRLTRQELEARGRPNEMVGRNLAVGWRDYVCFSIMARLGLREKHWGLFTYYADGSGHLRHDPTDGWQLLIPHVDFKNFRNQKIFTSHSREGVLCLTFSALKPLQPLIPVLELYIKEVRPIIAGEGNFLFPTFNGTAMSGHSLYAQFATWTRKYLSQYSFKPTAIKGVLPFGPHAMRDILATHFIKTTRDISLAANILLDSEEMVRKHYARFLPKDRMESAMAKLAGAFEADDEDKEEEGEEEDD